MVGEYRSAAVCRRGHVASDDTQVTAPSGPRCAICGAEILTSCTACKARIRGRYRTPRVISAMPFTPSGFCDACGAPHPWATRQQRLWELENLLDTEDISEADRLTVREQLEALRSGDLDENEAVERWQRIKKMAPGLWQSGQQIITTIATAAIQKKIGI